MENLNQVLNQKVTEGRQQLERWASGLRFQGPEELFVSMELRSSDGNSVTVTQKVNLVSLLSKFCTDFNFEVRARRFFYRLGIVTLGDLIQKSAQDLLEAKNFGKTSLETVREKLYQLGLKLKGD